MKSKLYKGVILSVVCILLLQGTALALGGRSTLASEYIMGTYANIFADRNGGITVGANIVGTGKMSEIGITAIYLYENNGTTTSLVKIFRSTDEEYSYLMGSNKTSHTAEVQYDGLVGYQYYARVYFKAGDSTGSDTFDDFTPTVTAKKY